MNNAWFWEIEQDNGGPNYYLTLEFEATAAAIAQWVAPQIQPTYQQQATSPVPYRWHHRNSGTWYYTAIELQDGYLTVIRGGGDDRPGNDGFLQSLLAAPRWPLKRWRVTAGGEGYGIEYFRSGTDVPSFQRYCGGEAKPPDFPQVLQCLRQALSRLKTDTRYTLGEPEIEGGMMTVPVFYAVPFKEGAWLTYPADQELSDVAREVSDQCDVPALASVTSRHDPHDFQQVIGGSFYFGPEPSCPSYWGSGGGSES
jgi:hypothetical protein